MTTVRTSSWVELAACRHLDPDVFFSSEHRTTAQATCAACPVRPACLDYARRNGIEHGVWGGETMLPPTQSAIEELATMALVETVYLARALTPADTAPLRDLLRGILNELKARR